MKNVLENGTLRRFAIGLGLLGLVLAFSQGQESQVNAVGPDNNGGLSSRTNVTFGTERFPYNKFVTLEPGDGTCNNGTESVRVTTSLQGVDSQGNLGDTLVVSSGDKCLPQGQFDASTVGANAVPAIEVSPQ